MLALLEINELEIALHRKLLNINQDIRNERKKKHPDLHVIDELKIKSKSIDKALNKIKVLSVDFGKNKADEGVFHWCKELYKST